MSKEKIMLFMVSEIGLSKTEAEETIKLSSKEDIIRDYKRALKEQYTNKEGKEETGMNKDELIVESLE